MDPTRRKTSSVDWLEVTFYKRGNPIRRWRKALNWLAALLAASWIVWAALRDNPSIYQAGPVSTPHSLFGNRCEMCHTEHWKPIVRLATFDSAVHSVSDLACTRCHAGPDHNEIKAKDCVTCHREHRGNELLARVSDEYCVICHNDLARATERTVEFHSQIPDFASHPEFRLLTSEGNGLTREDEAKLKFGHYRHLKEPLPVEPRIPGQEQQRVKLECADCHQTAEQRNYMKPIRYDDHCARCHRNSLTYDADRFPDQPVPHRFQELSITNGATSSDWELERQIGPIRGAIRDNYTRFIQKHPEELERTFVTDPSKRRMPGPQPRYLTEAQWSWVDQQVENAKRILFRGSGNCSKCHFLREEESYWWVEPPRVPDRWFLHARFDHHPHRMLRCSQCHAADTSKETSDILLPSIETCKGCHGSLKQQPFAARSDCVECHVYHSPAGHFDPQGTFTANSSTWTRQPKAEPHPGEGQ